MTGPSTFLDFFAEHNLTAESMEEEYEQRLRQAKSDDSDSDHDVDTSIAPTTPDIAPESAPLVANQEMVAAVTSFSVI